MIVFGMIASIVSNLSKKTGIGMKSLISFLVFCIILSSISIITLSASEITQRIEIPSSFNPVGSGARALGMGGAFIAVADDATAASWNPGGLIQLKYPEFSFVMDTLNRREDNRFGKKPEASGMQSVSKSAINYLSLAYPVKLFKRNMVFSLNYQHLFELSRRWRFPFKEEGITESNIDYIQRGGLYALGLAYCIQVTPEFSLGFTFNIWDHSLYKSRWEQNFFEKGWMIYKNDPQDEQYNFEKRSLDSYCFRGINANLGLLWRLSRKLTIGGVFKAPFRADINYETRISTSVYNPNYPDYLNNNIPGPIPTLFEEQRLDMPMSYGIGFAYRFSDEFTLAADIYRTEWGDFLLTDQDGRKRSPISGNPSDVSDIDPTHQIRAGAEYLFISMESDRVIPLRFGIFYDPAPAEVNPDDYFGCSLGSGIATRHLVFDMAYQYRFGNRVGDSILQHFQFSQDVREHKLYSSIIVFF